VRPIATGPPWALRGDDVVPLCSFGSDVEEGTGPSPVAGQTIRCHYTGKLTTGFTFDSSYDRGRPLTFNVGVGQVIKGWDEGILGGEGITPMKEGGKRKLIIPSELAYGSRGAGGVIPPNATLMFDVELLPLTKSAKRKFF